MHDVGNQLLCGQAALHTAKPLRALNNTEITEVEPSTNPSDGAGEDDNATVVVSIDCVERRVEVVDHPDSESIQLVRPIEGDASGATRGLVNQQVVRQTCHPRVTGTSPT
ncbi:MAG: hypothetical protein ACI8RE_001468 [Ilumatobacter sp.]|jgi:hypothetical protein